MTDEQLKEIEELQEALICKGGPKKGQPKKDADPAGLVQLKALLDEQRSETPEPTGKLEKPKKVKKIKLAKAPAKTKDAREDEVALEREIRRYVKKAGGFRADMSDDGIAEGKRVLKLAGRKVEDGWNELIAVPGM